MTTEEKLILDNVNLAYNIAWKYYKTLNNQIEFDDLKSICLLGLVKSGKTFKKDLNFAFSTYAYKIIVNEILLYLNHNKNKIKSISIYEEIKDDLSIIDILKDDFDLITTIETNNYIDKLYEEIEKLPENYRVIINYRLNGLTIQQIADKIGKSQPQISRDLNKIINILRNRFEIDKEVD